MCEIEEEFTNELQEGRSSLAEKECFGELEENYVEVINQNYKEKETRFLGGKEAELFWNRIKCQQNLMS